MNINYLQYAAVFASFLGAVKFYMSGGKNKYYPGLHEKVIIITGANTGIGYQTAREMLKLQPHKIILACRDQTRGQNAVKSIKEDLKTENLEFMQLDLNDLDSVKNFSLKFKAKYDRLDILINNAGIMALPNREVTAQNFEKQFGVNHMGHFLLTTLLMDLLKKSTEGRIVNVSSLAHGFGNFNFEDIQRKKNYSAWGAYGQSKLANVYFARHMDTLFKQQGVNNVKVVSLHPGAVRTELGRNMFSNPIIERAVFFITGPFYYLLTKSSLQGAQTSLHCSLIDFEKLESGKYYADCAVKQEQMPN